MLILAVIYIVFISLGLPDSMFGASWPVVHLDFGLPESYASVYSIITGVCTGGVSILAGWLLRRFGTPRVTLVSIIITALGLIGISLSPNILVMMLSSIILSYGAGAIDTGLNNFIATHYEAKHMNWMHCFYGLGVTISPLILSVFLGGAHGGWRNGYRVVALLQILIALCVVSIMKPWLKIDTARLDSGNKDSKTRRPKILSQVGVICGISALGSYTAIEFTIGTWGATYLVNTVALSPQLASKTVSCYFLGLMFGRLTAGFTSKWLNDNQLVRLGLLSTALGLILLLLPIKNISMLSLFIVGGGCGPVFPNILHSIPDRFGKSFSAEITGYHMGGAYAMGFTFQLVFGLVASKIGYTFMPLILIALCAVTMLLNEISVKKARHIN